MYSRWTITLAAAAMLAPASRAWAQEVVFVGAGDIGRCDSNADEATAEVLDRLSEVIRERYKLLSHARVLSTQHRWSAILVGLSPVAFAVIFHLMNPKYFDAFWQSGAAPRLLALGLALQLIGFFCVWRISKIKV